MDTKETYHVVDDVKQKFAEVPTSMLLKAVDQIKAVVDWLKSEDLHSEEFYTLLAARSIPIYVRWRLLKGNLPKFVKMSTHDEIRQFTIVALYHKFYSQKQFRSSMTLLTEEEIQHGWFWKTPPATGES